MAVVFNTTTASSLLRNFESAITQAATKGKITTWEIVNHQGVHYFTHKAPE